MPIDFLVPEWAEVICKNNLIFLIDSSYFTYEMEIVY